MRLQTILTHFRLGSNGLTSLKSFSSDEGRLFSSKTWLKISLFFLCAGENSTYDSGQHQQMNRYPTQRRTGLRAPSNICGCRRSPTCRRCFFFQPCLTSDGTCSTSGRADVPPLSAKTSKNRRNCVRHGTRPALCAA